MPLISPPPTRSLPGAVSKGGTAPAVEVDTTTSNQQPTKMAGAGFVNFSKTIVLPILIALLLYIVLFHFLLPFYHRHHARYSQYLPLSSTSNLTSRLPSPLQPSSLRSYLTRLFLPSAWAARYQQNASSTGHNRTNSFLTDDESESDNISAESGEAMVGFDIQEQQRRRRRDGMERQVARGITAAREMGMGYDEQDVEQQRRRTEIPPERRLSRELEEVFRDDSDEDEEDEEHGVTVRRISVSR